MPDAIASTLALPASAQRHPPLPCNTQGWLDVGDGHSVYYEVSGHPLAAAALFLHGGPGAGCSGDDRRWFDPQRWRIVAFDQRGAGRSRPLGRLQANTTEHLLHDIEALRVHLGLERWLIFGGSWGSTLALAYAQRHPGRVQALVLRGVFTATACEIRWLTAADGAARLHPQGWQRWVEAVAAAPDSSLLDAAAQRLQQGGAAAQAVAKAWLGWEQDLIDLDTPGLRSADMGAPLAPTDLATASIGLHYARHAYFLTEGQLLNDASRLADIEGVIVQGGLDRVTPPSAAEALQRAWPAARLERVDGAGHASCHPQVTARLVAAVDALHPQRPCAAGAPVRTAFSFDEEQTDEHITREP